MGKRLVVGLLIVAGLAAAGVWTYRRYEATKPKTLFPGEATTVVAPREPERSGGTAGSSSETMPAGVEKGASSAAGGFQPRTGETLDFAANVPKLNSVVANLRVKVGERRTVAGKDAWHLQAFAHTENPYRMVFELDDEFDSYSEISNLTSLKYEMHLNERGQKVDTVERMTSSSREPAPANEVAARVLPGTRDPIGMLMYLRSVDWGTTKEVKSPVFDGHKLYDVRAVLVGKGQNVSVAAGKYSTTKIEIHVLENGTEMKDAHFLLYLADGAERLPVLMEAVLPVATARVELVKAR
ncbi:MAG TPA: DUF3108 domain-containing protein [Candidatus Acidoferrum sp.]|nr:DUF3108 domain-containing protein [Candidatus Acidoferrum sp.]